MTANAVAKPDTLDAWTPIETSIYDGRHLHVNATRNLVLTEGESDRNFKLGMRR